MTLRRIGFGPNRCVLVAGTLLIAMLGACAGGDMASTEDEDKDDEEYEYDDGATPFDTEISQTGGSHGGGQAGTKAHESTAMSLRDLGYNFTSDLGDDAYDHTFGVMRIRYYPLVDGYGLRGSYTHLNEEPAVLKGERFIYARKAGGGALDPAALTAADRVLLNELCKDLFVSPSLAALATPTNATPTKLGVGEMYVAWRSHHPAAAINDYTALLLSSGAEFKCGLEITLVYENAQTAMPTVLLFDPFSTPPVGKHPIDLYRGVAQAKAKNAVEAGLMLIENRPFSNDDYPLTGYAKIPVTEAGELRRGVKALNPKSITASSASVGGHATCKYRLTSTLQAENGGEAQELRVTFSAAGGVPLTLADAMLANAASPGCGSFAVAKEATGFKANFTCEAYGTTLQANVCEARVVLQNEADPRNTIRMNQKINGLITETTDLTKKVNAESLMPEYLENAVRNGSVILTGFNSQRRTAVERAVDFWMAVSRNTYEAKFVPMVATIIYDGDCTDAGGYAPLGMDLGEGEVYWCLAGAMEDNMLKNDLSPSYHVYRAMLLMHETLHNYGADHDYEDPTIPPCLDTGGLSGAGGTAYAGVVTYDAYHCTADYCYAFRDAAKSELALELDYSLENDPRRFQGQCKTWTDAMGVVLD